MQPQMFSKKFVNRDVLPNIAGQPSLVSSPVHFFMNIFLVSPIIMNIIIILVQLLIAILIFYKKSAKVGLSLSIVWGLFIWYIGEGLGGLFLGNGNFSLLMGAPGSALLYVILAIAVMPKEKDTIPARGLIFV